MKTFWTVVGGLAAILGAFSIGYGLGRDTCPPPPEPIVDNSIVIENVVVKNENDREWAVSGSKAWEIHKVARGQYEYNKSIDVVRKYIKVDYRCGKDGVIKTAGPFTNNNNEAFISLDCD